MQIWDTAGQEKFNSVINNYYKGTDVAIYIYSIDNKDTFDSIQNWFQEVKKNSGQNVINILIGNKKDLENENRNVTNEMGENYAVYREFFLFREVTCKSKDDEEIENIMEIFDEIGKYFYTYYKRRKIGSSSADMNYQATTSLIKIGEKKRKTKKKKCCG